MKRIFYYELISFAIIVIVAIVICFYLYEQETPINHPQLHEFGLTEIKWKLEDTTIGKKEITYTYSTNAFGVAKWLTECKSFVLYDELSPVDINECKDEILSRIQYIGSCILIIKEIRNKDVAYVVDVRCEYRDREMNEESIRVLVKVVQL